jgi:hypothetical protein
MGYKRNIGRDVFAVALLLGTAEPAVAQPREPLIVTALGEPKLTLTKIRSGDDPESAVDDAIENFGRVIGQARLAEQQAIEAKCRSTRPAPDSATDRFAWAANCRYSRH